MLIQIFMVIKVQEILRTGLKIKRSLEPCLAVQTAAANKFLVDVTAQQLREAVVEIGGFYNFNVKYGKQSASKSYVIPESKVPLETLRQWDICK